MQSFPADKNKQTKGNNCAENRKKKSPAISLWYKWAKNWLNINSVGAGEKKPERVEIRREKQPLYQLARPLAVTVLAINHLSGTCRKKNNKCIVLVHWLFYSTCSAWRAHTHTHGSSIYNRLNAKQQVVLLLSRMCSLSTTQIKGLKREEEEKKKKTPP